MWLDILLLYFVIQLIHHLNPTSGSANGKHGVLALMRHGNRGDHYCRTGAQRYFSTVNVRTPLSKHTVIKKSVVQQFQLSEKEQQHVRSRQKRAWDPKLNVPLTIPLINSAKITMDSVYPGFNPTVIVASPFTRTVATSILMAQKISFDSHYKPLRHLKIVLDPRFGEVKKAVIRCTQGLNLDIEKNKDLLRFATVDEFKSTFAPFAERFALKGVEFEQVKTATKFEFAGQAQVHDMEEAVEDWMQFAEHTGQDVLILTHDAVVRYAAQYIHDQNTGDSTSDASLCKQSVQECGFAVVKPHSGVLFDSAISRKTIRSIHSCFSFAQSELDIVADSIPCNVYAK